MNHYNQEFISIDIELYTVIYLWSNLFKRFSLMVEVNDKIPYKGSTAIVRFKGETSFAPGIWLGLELNNPTGKNNGSVNGVSYFACSENCGIFIKETSLLIDGDSKMKLVIDRLQEKLYLMNIQINDLTSCLSESQNQNNKLELALSGSSQNNEVLLMEKETIEDHMELLEQELSHSILENKSLQQEIEVLKGHLDSDKINLIDRNIELEKAIVTLRDFLQGKEMDSDIYQMPNGLPSESVEISDGLEDSKLLIRELEQELHDLKRKVVDMEHLSDDYQRIVALNEELKERISEVEDLISVQHDIERLNLEMERDLNNQIEELKLLVIEKEITITELKRKKSLTPQTSEHEAHSGMIGELIHRIQIITLEKERLLEKLSFFEFESSLIADEPDRIHYSKCIAEIVKMIEKKVKLGNFGVPDVLKMLRFKMLMCFVLVRIENCQNPLLQGIFHFKETILDGVLNGRFSDIDLLCEFRDMLDGSPYSRKELLTVNIKDEINSYHTFLSILNALGPLLNGSTLQKDIVRLFPSKDFEMWATRSISQISDLEFQQLEDFEFTGVISKLINVCFDDLLREEFGEYQSGTKSNGSFRSILTPIIDYFNIFVPPYVSLKIRSKPNGIATAINRSDDLRLMNESSDIKSGLELSRRLDFNQLREIIRLLRDETHELKTMNSFKDHKISEVSGENLKLRRDIKALTKSAFIGSIGILNASTMYEDANKVELLQKSHNANSSLKQICNANIKSIQPKWLNVEIQTSSTLRIPSDIKHLTIIGRELRKAFKNTSV